jgi:hypothetical protein
MPSKNVKVRAFVNDAGAVDFDIDGVKAQHSRLKLDKGSGSHEIIFDLQDQSDRGLQFNVPDPIWVDEDAPCPPTPGVSTDQLAVSECGPDKLKTVNQNSGRSRELRYQLNFTAADGSHPRCDPIIDNGGGVGGSS